MAKKPAKPLTTSSAMFSMGYQLKQGAKIIAMQERRITLRKVALLSVAIGVLLAIIIN